MSIKTRIEDEINNLLYKSKRKNIIIYVGETEMRELRETFAKDTGNAVSNVGEVFKHGDATIIEVKKPSYLHVCFERW